MATDDFPATTGTKGSVTVNGIGTNGALQFAGDVDYFKVSLIAGQSYLFDLVGDAISGLSDTYLSLLSSTGNQLAFNDDRVVAGVGGSSAIAYTATQSGTFFLAASTDTGSELGNYVLSATSVVDDLPASRSTSAVVTVNTDQWSGSIDYVGDADYIKVDLRAGTTYSFWLSSDGSQDAGLINSYMILRGPSGTVLTSDGSSKNTRINYAPSTTGTYYIEASSYDLAIGDYFVSVTTLSDDFAGNAGTTGKIKVDGSAVFGMLEVANDADWFKVTLEAGKRYVFDLAPDGPRVVYLPVLSLYGTDKATLLASNESGGDSEETPRAARIEFTATVSGTYYLGANEFDGIPGSYSIQASRLIDNDRPTLVSRVPEDDATSVLTASDLRFTFSEPVQAGRGSIMIRSVDGSDVRTIALDDDTQVRIDGRVLTVDPAAELEPGTGYSVTMASGVIEDLAGNDFLGLAGSGSYNFRTTVDDYASSAETIGWLVPDGPAVTGSLEVAGDRDLFRIELKAGQFYVIRPPVDVATGFAGIDLTIYDSELQQLDRMERSADSGPAASLAFWAQSSGTYYIGIDDADSGTGEYLVGVEIYDQLPPVLLSTSPSHGAAGIPRSGKLTFSFDEDVFASSGDVLVYRDDGVLAQRIGVQDESQVGFAGRQMTIDPAEDFTAGSRYYVVIPAGAVRDKTGYTFAGIDAGAAARFTTLEGNGSPQAADFAIQATEDEGFVGTYPTVVDPDADSVHVTAPLSRLGEFWFGESGAFTFMPRANVSGIEQVEYTVADSQGASNTYVVTLEIASVEDLFIGSDSADQIWHTESPGADTYELLGGNDTVNTGGGADRIDGGAGIDTVLIDATRTDCVVAASDAAWIVTAGGSMVATLTQVERLQFLGESLALDLGGAAGYAAKLIGGLFGADKLSDATLVGQWLQRVDDSTSFEAIVNQALGSPLFLQLAGSTSNTDFVDLVFTNVVGRAPDAGELASFVSLLDSGAFTQASLGVLACETELNAAHIGLAGLAETGLAYLPDF
ncbi:MAG TPA: Ig-like domain-containing protein [Solimonas sp.]|nr:Ig-like domain-containing protein [Solimonas sp.]